MAEQFARTISEVRFLGRGLAEKNDSHTIRGVAFE